MTIQEKLSIVQKLADLCYSCNACSTVCPTSLVGLFHPRKFMRTLIDVNINNYESIIKKEDLFNCLTCALCSEHCPMSTKAHGIKIPEMIRELRTYGYENHLISDELDCNSTHDCFMTTLPKLQSESKSWLNKVDYIESDPELEISKEGDIALFIGCYQAMEAKFKSYNIKYTDSARAAIKLLNKNNIKPVVIDTKCCGHDSYWTGDKETAKKLALFNIEQMNNAGVKTIIVNCAEGYRMWKYDYPKIIEGEPISFAFDVKHYSEYVVENGLIRNNSNTRNKSNNGDNKKLKQNSAPIKVTYHDPCRLGRLGGLYDQPREIIKGLPNVELIEMDEIKENSICCGISNFVGCNNRTKLIRMRRLEQALETGAEYLITTCPKCITHFKCYYIEHKDKNNEFPRLEKIKIVDLATFVDNILGGN